MEKKITIIAYIELTILNKENFNDFDTEEQRNFLTQEMLEQSSWPTEGINCTVKHVDLELP